MQAGTFSAQTQRLLDLVSPRVGIVRELTRLSRGINEPCPPLLYHAALSNFDFKTTPAIERASAGKGLTEEEAICGAIGEAIERYCASHIDQDRIQYRSIGDVGNGGIAPAECVLYADAQYARTGFPYLRPSAEMKIGWVPGRELPSGRELLIPAALVFLYGSGGNLYEPLCAATSSGLAAGPDLAAAVRGALCELIERDAFLLTWMNRLPAREIDPRSIVGPARDICEHYARFGLETHIFHLPSDVPIAAMMAVSIDRSGQGPAAVVGLGCHLDPRQAVLRSLFEICQVRPGEARRASRDEAAGRLQRYQDVRSLEDHSGFFAPLERLAELEFLFSHGGTTSLGALPNLTSASSASDLDVVVGHLEAAGCRVAYVDLTTPDIVETGVSVVRAIATGLQPIHFGFGEERLGGERLFRLPQRLGYDTRRRSAADLNPCPHPLA